jgi:hypothetical protein
MEGSLSSNKEKEAYNVYINLYSSKFSTTVSPCYTIAELKSVLPILADLREKGLKRKDEFWILPSYFIDEYITNVLEMIKTKETKGETGLAPYASRGPGVYGFD